MSVFADSSALVKLYAEEPGSESGEPASDWIGGTEQTGRSGAIAVSGLARVEVSSAFWRKCRLGEIAETEAADLTAEFEADLFGTAREAPRFAVIASTAAVLDRAAALLPIHGLRAIDSIQLASALEANSADPAISKFACFDRRLAKAAAAQGFELPPAA